MSVSKVELPVIPPQVQALLEGKYIIDLTEEVKRKPPGPFYGREKDILWVAEKVSCQNKDSVLVTGSAGVGKTLLYRQIAYLIMTGKAPVGLQNRRVFLFISDLKKVLDVLGQHSRDDFLMVVDEVHAYFRIGSIFTEELKPFIGNGRTPLIGLTDRWEEFMMDPPMRRRFQTLHLSEMAIPDAIEAFKASRSSLKAWAENFVLKNFGALGFQISIRDDAIETAVKLSVTYLPKEFLPDKVSKILEPAVTGKTIQFMQEKKPGVPLYLEITQEDIVQYVIREFKVTRSDVHAKSEDLDRALKTTPIPLTEPLMRHTLNLNQEALLGKILPAYGRDLEMRNVITILSGLESNNVILCGEPGCGKTRIGEGLAYLMVHGQVPESMRDMLVLLLDLNSLVGKTEYRGQFEEKVGEFLRSAEKYAGQFILMIDEAHRLVGSGRTEHGHDDVANQLKALLARGKLRVLGMTTPLDFQSMQSDPAFLRRFQVQNISPFSVAQTVQVLNLERDHFQKAYSAKMKRPFSIEPAAMEATAYLAVHYLPKEFLPASAYKIFHGACAHAGMQRLPVLTEGCVIDYVTEFLQKKHDRSLAEKDLVRLKAELHPINSLIPVHEPIIRFTENWTNKARQGLFRRSLHRTYELQSMINTLGCVTINNILLVSRAGGGKTSLIKQLAISMVRGEVPPFLQNCLLLTLKLQDLLNEEKTNPNVITDFIESASRYEGHFVLFTDEFHTFFEARTRQGIPIYELFKPILAEGKVRLIGATTPEDAKEYILDKGESILRRLSIQVLAELGVSESIDVLADARPFYEEYYSKQKGKPFKIDPAIFETLVLQAKERLNYQALPASAITLLEQICSKSTASIVTQADLKSRSVSWFRQLFSSLLWLLRSIRSLVTSRT